MPRHTPNQVLGAPSSRPCSSCKFFLFVYEVEDSDWEREVNSVLINWHLAGLPLFFQLNSLNPVLGAPSRVLVGRVGISFRVRSGGSRLGEQGEYGLLIGAWHVWRSSLSRWSLLEVLMVISGVMLSTVIIGLEPAQSWKLELSLEVLMRLQLTSRRYLR